MATAAAVRALLGNKVRFWIDVTGFAANVQRVAARWECGCYAEGRSFSELHVRPCERHRDALPEHMIH